jgi:hypothetical protein
MYRVSLLATDLHDKLASRRPARKVRVCVLNALRRERILLVHSDLDRLIGNELIELPTIPGHVLGFGKVSEDSEAKRREYMGNSVNEL